MILDSEAPWLLEDLLSSLDSFAAPFLDLTTTFLTSLLLVSMDKKHIFLGSTYR